MQRHLRGFTLIELLVAMGVMALMAMMSWQGLDGMHRAQSQTAQRADELLTLQAGLSQWGADLDAMVEPLTQTRKDDAPPPPVLDWDGRALRLVRRNATAMADGWRVVAWTRRGDQSAGQWLRWQSPPLRTRGELQLAWQKAALWAQNPGDEERKREVTLAPLTQWQIFYYRNNGWSNPLSASPEPAANPFGATSGAVPDGIRLVLTLPPGHSLAGVLTRDWAPPAYGGSRS